MSPPPIASIERRFSSARFISRRSPAVPSVGVGSATDKRYSLSHYMRPVRVTLALILASTVAIANADSIEFGATALCAKKPREFELAAIVQHNEETTALSAYPGDAKQLKYGTHKLRCGVGGRAVSMVVHVNPAMGGHCMGAGYVSITGFRVGSRPIPLDWPAQSFNHKCIGGQMLVRFSVKRAGSRVVVERCSSDDWTWENGYSKLVCTEQVIE